MICTLMKPEADEAYIKTQLNAVYVGLSICFLNILRLTQNMSVVVVTRSSCTCSYSAGAQSKDY